MRKFNILTAVAAISLAGGVAVAKDKPEAAEGAKEKKICKTEADTTSRLGGKRICRTKAEWDAISADSRRMVDGATRN
jgi:hypothetical protein